MRISNLGMKGPLYINLFQIGRYACGQVECSIVGYGTKGVVIRTYQLRNGGLAT